MIYAIVSPDHASDSAKGRGLIVAVIANPTWTACEEPFISVQMNGPHYASRLSQSLTYQNHGQGAVEVVAACRTQ
jgi:hypothetical protein